MKFEEVSYTLLGQWTRKVGQNWKKKALDLSVLDQNWNEWAVWEASKGAVRLSGDSRVEGVGKTVLQRFILWQKNGLAEQYS